MRKLIFALLLIFPLLAVAQPVVIQPVRVPVLQQLQWVWTVVCEVGLGGEFTYDQTDAGPTGWYCKDATKTPVKDRVGG